MNDFLTKVFNKKHWKAWIRGRGLFNYMDDCEYISMEFLDRMGYRIDLKNPKTFNEKIQWLKLYDRNPMYSTMVDKYEAKKYVAERIGDEYIIPTYGIWDRFDEISFANLPKQYVLKCTHDSGGLAIVRNADNVNFQAVKKKINKSLRTNFYMQNREWPYKNVTPRIIAEKYMENDDGQPLRDYKFYCFDGEPKFLYISEGMENHATAKISFLSCDWKFASYERSDYQSFKELPPKPTQFEKMKAIASKLSLGIPFLRVDLYEINGHIYFSELTFSPCGGFMPFKNAAHDYDIGSMLSLPME